MKLVLKLTVKCQCQQTVQYYINIGIVSRALGELIDRLTDSGPLSAALPSHACLSTKPIAMSSLNHLRKLGRRLHKYKFYY